MDRFLENETIVKILAVVMAILLWFIVSSSNPAQVVTRQFGPISVTEASLTRSNLTASSVVPGTITVTIKGSPRGVESAKIQDFTAFVDLSSIAHAGTYSLPVHVSAPTGTSLVSVVPKNVVVTVEKIGTRKLPVSLRILGTPSPGYELKSSSASVKTATINGPTTELDLVRNLIADVSVGGHSSGFQEQVILLPVNKHGQVVPHVQVSPNLVAASVSIAAIPPHKTVPVVVKYTGSPATGYTIQHISVSPTSVEITGTTSALSGVTAIDTQPVSVSGQTSSIAETMTLVFPKGTSAVTVNKVTVTITIAPKG